MAHEEADKVVSYLLPFSMDLTCEFENYIISLAPKVFVERINKFRRRADYLRSLLGFALARWCYFHHSTGEEKSFLVNFADNGKPFVPNSDCYFNISHSNGFVACAVCVGERVGIDIESSKNLSLSLAQQILSPQEITDFLNVESSQQTKHLCRVWALKESYLKLLGTGITVDLRKLTVLKAVSYQSYAPINSLANFAEFDVGNEYFMATCSDSFNLDKKMRYFDEIDKLIF